MSDEATFGETHADSTDDAEFLASFRTSCAQAEEQWRLLHQQLIELPADDEEGLEEISAAMTLSSTAFELVTDPLKTFLSSLEQVTALAEIPGLGLAEQMVDAIAQHLPTLLSQVTQLVTGATRTAGALDVRGHGQRQALTEHLANLSWYVDSMLTGLLAMSSASNRPVAYLTEVRSLVWNHAEECRVTLAAYSAGNSALLPPAIAEMAPPRIYDDAASGPRAELTTSSGPAGHPPVPRFYDDEAEQGWSSAARKISRRRDHEEQLRQLMALPLDELFERLRDGDIDALDTLVAAGYLDLDPATHIR